MAATLFATLNVVETANEPLVVPEPPQLDTATLDGGEDPLEQIVPPPRYRS